MVKKVTSSTTKVSSREKKATDFHYHSAELGKKKVPLHQLGKFLDDIKRLLSPSIMSKEGG